MIIPSYVYESHFNTLRALYWENISYLLNLNISVISWIKASGTARILIKPRTEEELIIHILCKKLD